MTSVLQYRGRYCMGYPQAMSGYAFAVRNSVKDQYISLGLSANLTVQSVQAMYVHTNCKGSI